MEFDTHLPSENKNTNYIFQVSVDPQTNFNEWTKYESTTKLELQTTGDMVFEKYITADLYYSLNYILKQNGEIFRFMTYPYDANIFPKDLSKNIDQALPTFNFLEPTANPSATPTASSSAKPTTKPSASPTY